MTRRATRCAATRNRQLETAAERERAQDDPVLGLAVPPQATQMLPHPRADQTCQLIVRKRHVRHGRDDLRGWSQWPPRVPSAEAGKGSASEHECAASPGLVGGRNDGEVNGGGCERGQAGVGAIMGRRRAASSQQRPAQSTRQRSTLPRHRVARSLAEAHGRERGQHTETSVGQIGGGAKDGGPQ